MKLNRLTKIRLWFSLAAMLGLVYAGLVASWNPEAEKPDETATPPSYLSERPFPSAESCRQCHRREYEEWSRSFHAISSSGPTFQAMYRIYTYNTGGKDPAACLNCHAPEVQVLGNYDELHQKIMNKEHYSSEGVSCTVCHGLRDVGQIDYSGYARLDLKPREMPPYHDYMVSELHKMEQFCAKCHDYNTAPFGAECCTPTRDWEKTRFAQEGVGCIDCHMRSQMGLMAEAPSLRQWLLQAIELLTYADDRGRVSHLFPGQHHAEFVQKAVREIQSGVSWGRSRKASRRLKLMNESLSELPRTESKAQLERYIDQRTGGRVYGLCVETVEGRIIVSGRTATHYVRQLALAAVLESRTPERVEIEIEVGSR